MSKKYKVGIGALVVAVLLSALMVGVVFAQDDGTTTEAPSTRMGKMPGMGGRGMRGDSAGMQAIADLLGMTTDELSAELWGGRTLADLAEAAGIDLLTLQEAAQAANEQAMRDAIEQSVVDGDRTREHADWLLEGLDNGYIGGKGFDGFDRMGGRPSGRGMGTTGMSGRFQRMPSAGSEAL